MNDDPMPSPPQGYAACRAHDGSQKLIPVGATVQVTHLVVSTSRGTPGPTMCGLTRFDHTTSEGVLVGAELPGWSIGGGVHGPGIVQEKCTRCFDVAAARDACGHDVDELPRAGEPWTACFLCGSPMVVGRAVIADAAPPDLSVVADDEPIQSRPLADIEKLRALGVILEVNRQLLHPIGYALAVDEHGALMIFDGSDDPGGVRFGDWNDERRAKAKSFAEVQEQRRPAREAALGYFVEPVPEAEVGRG